MRFLVWRARRALALLLALLLCGAAWADPPGRVGRLADLQGTVWIADPQSGEWLAAERNRPLTTGDHLATDRDARAELRIGSTTVWLGPDTELVVVQLDDRRMRLQLEHGSLAARLRQPDTAAEFEALTAEGRFLPQQPGHYRIDRNGEATAAAVWNGELRFDARDSTLTVPQGQRAEFWQEAGVTHYTWSAMPQDDFGQWALAEDRQDDRQPPGRYVSPEMTGAEDLDRYGRWDQHPEYGTLWIPAQVAPGWAPYRHGRWAWVRPWGWTWVDEAPWGFAPFHYGRWLWWGGRWCWAPGAYVAQPVYAPALVGWMGEPQVGVSITIGSGPLVGWVPLGPRDPFYPGYGVSPGYWRHVNPQVPDRFYRPKPPSRPVAYSNRGVPGAITVVPVDVVKRRRPVAPALPAVDPRWAHQLAEQKTPVRPPPPPPAAAAPTRVTVPRPPARPQARSSEEPVEGRRSHGVVTAPAQRAPAPEAPHRAPPRTVAPQPALPNAEPAVRPPPAALPARPVPPAAAPAPRVPSPAVSPTPAERGAAPAVPVADGGPRPGPPVRERAPGRPGSPAQRQQER